MKLPLNARSTQLILICLLLGNGSGFGETLELKSPGEKFTVTIEPRPADSGSNLAAYSVSWMGQPIVPSSNLALELEGGAFTGPLEVVSADRSENDSTWEPVCGERSKIRDHFRQVRLLMTETQPPHRSIALTFRAYDEGVAFHYEVPQQKQLTAVKINREHSEFRFPADHRAWIAYKAQADYVPARISDIKSGCERPLTVQAGEDLYLAVGEARLVDYARMKFGPLKEAPHALVSELEGPVEATLPLRTPWRVIMAAESPGRLLENNFLFLNLNDPCALEDTSWIKPGKVIREVTLTTAGGKACVDFAVKHGLQFVHYDAGWYGHEYDDAADASAVTVDPKRSKGPLDLPDVIAYARERGIGVILYVNRRALEKQLDDILPLYRKWGISGVKYGFVNVGSQEWTDWLHTAIRKAAENRLMVDVHDEYRPTGYQRTYPNFMTAEGIAGDETSPENTNTLTILFTRLLCGPADNTVCYYDSRVKKNATHAYQLAKAVCLYSPWQYLYWYDRPGSSPRKTGGAGGSHPTIGDEPELEFYDVLPTVWDDTRVIHGRIGEYAVIARRSGDNWYIGAMNSTEARTLEVPLDFLPPGKPYTAHIYSDDPAVDTFTQVRIDRKPADSGDVLQISMSKQGGQAIRLTPKE